MAHRLVITGGQLNLAKASQGCSTAGGADTGGGDTTQPPPVMQHSCAGSAAEDWTLHRVSRVITAISRFLFMPPACQLVS